MAKHVKLTASGALELPPGLAERKGWHPETQFEVEETATGLEVRVVEQQELANHSFDYEAFRRNVPKHEGPPVSIEDMNKAIDLAMAERWARKEANSR